MTESETRFLREVSERLAADRVAEVFLFPTIRQGADDSGVAVIAEAAEGASDRYAVYRATYRHTVKGPERGTWAVEVTAEADAPLDAVSAVVRGVQRRSALAAEPDKLTGNEFRSVVAGSGVPAAADAGAGTGAA